MDAGEFPDINFQTQEVIMDRMDKKALGLGTFIVLIVLFMAMTTFTTVPAGRWQPLRQG
jgi:hypothetical protein